MTVKYFEPVDISSKDLNQVPFVAFFKSRRRQPSQCGINLMPDLCQYSVCRISIQVFFSTGEEYRKECEQCHDLKMPCNRRGQKLCVPEIRQLLQNSVSCNDRNKDQTHICRYPKQHCEKYYIEGWRDETCELCQKDQSISAAFFFTGFFAISLTGCLFRKIHQRLVNLLIVSVCSCTGVECAAELKDLPAFFEGCSPCRVVFESFLCPVELIINSFFKQQFFVCSGFPD